MLLVVKDPAGASTRIEPVRAPVETLTEIAPLLRTLKLLANAPPNRTAIAPRKFVPVTSTFVPVRPLPGENPVMMGGAKKLVIVVLVPEAERTLIGPVDTPAGASTVMELSD